MRSTACGKTSPGTPCRSNGIDAKTRSSVPSAQRSLLAWRPPQQALRRRLAAGGPSPSLASPQPTHLLSDAFDDMSFLTEGTSHSRESLLTSCSGRGDFLHADFRRQGHNTLPADWAKTPVVYVVLCVCVCGVCCGEALETTPNKWNLCRKRGLTLTKIIRFGTFFHQQNLPFFSDVFPPFASQAWALGIVTFWESPRQTMRVKLRPDDVDYQRGRGGRNTTRTRTGQSECHLAKNTRSRDTKRR